MIISQNAKRKPGIIEIYPKFIIRKDDLTIRGGSLRDTGFEERGILMNRMRSILTVSWTNMLRKPKRFDDNIRVTGYVGRGSGMIDSWH